MPRLMYDSVNANAIPTDATMVAGYVDGKFAWSQANWNRFPGAVKVRISAVGATHLAHVFDVEDGCIWPPERVVPLVVAARKAGIDPTVYVNERNDWGPTRAAFDRAGVAHPHWWVANYDGNDHYISPGAVARQFAHPPNSAGHYDPAHPNRPTAAGHYDLSIVANFWPGVDAGVDEGEAMSWGENLTNYEGKPVKAGDMLAYVDENIVELDGKVTRLTDTFTEALEQGLPTKVKLTDEDRAAIVADLTRLVPSKESIAEAVVAELKKEGN